MTIQDKANNAASWKFPLFENGEGDNITMSLWQRIYEQGYMHGLSELWQEVDVNNLPKKLVLAKVEGIEKVQVGCLHYNEWGGAIVPTEWSELPVTHYIEIETLLNILKETK